MNGARLLALGLFLAIPGTLAAEPLTMGDGTRLERVVAATAEARTLTFEARILPDAERPLYAKVLPTPGNPAHGNGTVDGPGWWTEMWVLSPEPRLAGKTNGSSLVELGTFNRSAPLHLEIRIHVPAGALLREAEIAVNYVVAARAPVNQSSSGASLNPSILVQPRIVVDAGGASVADGIPAALPPWLLPLAGGVALLGAIGGMVVARKRMGGGAS